MDYPCCMLWVIHAKQQSTRMSAPISTPKEHICFANDCSNAIVCPSVCVSYAPAMNSVWFAPSCNPAIMLCNDDCVSQRHTSPLPASAPHPPPPTTPLPAHLRPLPPTLRPLSYKNRKRHTATLLYTSSSSSSSQSRQCHHHHHVGWKGFRVLRLRVSSGM
jgi:hypothetical protein